MPLTYSIESRFNRKKRHKEASAFKTAAFSVFDALKHHKRGLELGVGFEAGFKIRFGAFGVVHAQAGNGAVVKKIIVFFKRIFKSVVYDAVIVGQQFDARFKVG